MIKQLYRLLTAETTFPDYYIFPTPHQIIYQIKIFHGI